MGKGGPGFKLKGNLVKITFRGKVSKARAKTRSAGSNFSLYKRSTFLIGNIRFGEVTEGWMLQKNSKS
ncbi:MAG: hypothetical protein Ct9H300mP17_16460 [Candidatus Nitrosopelagicus sp.]|nr:MAG: hypothetical protein Ct9H300mP17_16460 [Candidatus Nitrosopelagicus sp.]